MPLSRPPEPWDSFLSELDALAGQTIEFHCFGGFVATMLYKVPRATADVDILPVTDRSITGGVDLIEVAGKGSDLHKKYKLYVDVVAVTTYPEDYAGRLTEMFPGVLKNLRILALDPYDLALMKLERNDRKDRDDVVHMALNLPLDVEVLKERYSTEYRPYLLNEERIDGYLEVWIEIIEEQRKKQKSTAKVRTK
jgi:hypothetical protein